jgi:DNA-binding transcriptional ArsR family regulator
MLLVMPSSRRPAPAPDASVVPAAELLADASRVTMLWALMDGRRLPAGDLARLAGIRASTASEHLARLVHAGWLGVEQVGRHRYLRLIHPGVAELLETMAVLDGVSTPTPRAVGPTGAMRLARSCYDHLAGQAGVALTEALLQSGTLLEDSLGYRVSAAGRERFAAWGIDTDALAHEATTRRRHFARMCLDWSERRYHVAGALGAALLGLVLERGWFERQPETRALRLTNSGRRALQRELGVRLL